MRTFLSFLLGWTCALPLQARTLCCEVGGRTYCDEGLPAACYGKAHRELNARGETQRQIDAPLTPEQRVQREAELVKKREEEERQREEDKKNRKLLGTYPSLRELDEAQARMLEDMQKSLETTRQREGVLKSERKKLDAEAEFYRKRPMPSELKTQIANNDAEQERQGQNIKDRQSDLDAATIRFAEERKRYVEMKNMRGPLSQ